MHTVCFIRWSGLASTQRSEASQRLILAPELLSPEPSQPSPAPLLATALRAERFPEMIPPTGLQGPAQREGQGRLPPARLEALVPDVVVPTSRPHKPSLPAVIDLSHLDAELERDPVYLDYFRSLRERIRYHAQRNFPAASRGGEVLLQFVVTARGALQTVQVDPAGSSTDLRLQQASLSSVRQAAPFAPFPASFVQPQITFRIIVAYERAD